MRKLADSLSEFPDPAVSTSSRGSLAVSRKGMLGTNSLLLVLLSISAIAGGTWWWNTRQSQDTQTDAILHEVSLDDFILEITERGEILSADVTEVKSLVKSKNTQGVAILRIVPEGTKVDVDDFLVELDSSALQEERTAQRINYNTAQAMMIESQNVYETALIAKREYLEGTYLQERQLIESEVFVAEENLNRAKEYLEYSKKLAIKGYVNDLQLEADRFAVEKSEKELEAALTKLKVLDEFTREKILKQLDSDIAISKAKWEADKNSFELESEKLSEIEDQISKCVITSPKEGVIVYAHERDRRGDDAFIVEEGALVRERQTVIELPDPTTMQVELNINESLIQFVKEGMPAKVVPVGFGDQTLEGEVEHINQYAEPSGWRRANVKEYKAMVTLSDPPLGVRAGMTASVTILCERLNDVLQVPVQSVYAHGDQFYCMVYQAGEWEARPVVCGPTNDKFFVIEKGLDLQERVAMNPRRFINQVDLPKLPPERMQRAVAQAPEFESEVERASSNEQATDGTVETAGG